jgi:hypothetical protein
MLKLLQRFGVRYIRPDDRSCSVGRNNETTSTHGATKLRRPMLHSRYWPRKPNNKNAEADAVLCYKHCRRNYGNPVMGVTNKAYLRDRRKPKLVYTDKEDIRVIGVPRVCGLKIEGSNEVSVIINMPFLHCNIKYNLTNPYFLQIGFL